MKTKSRFFSVDHAQKTLRCRGAWTLKTLMSLKKSLSSINVSSGLSNLDGGAITSMDSAGALVLSQWLKSLSEEASPLKLDNFKDEYLKLIKLVSLDEKWSSVQPVKRPNIFARVGIVTVHNILESVEFLSFIGEIAVTSMKLLAHPKRIPWRSVMSTVEVTGVNALPIIGLLSFLIGIVLTYQMGLQLRNYGANIYIVDFLGLSLLREFAPLMTAIIIAGRSGSAFTAQLGTMKIREEIDALRTMGLSPIELLIIPKGIGLFFVLPLLTVWASLFGLFGGMIMSKFMLDISYAEFLHRFYTAIPIRAYAAGMIKAPIFGLIIAAIGCYQGTKVTGSATSVGEKTTTSVVQAIFFIIVMDAVFSVIFKWLNI